MKYNFNYLEHYKTDAKEFDYFEEKHLLVIEEEEKVHRAILDKLNSKDKLILDIGSGNGWLSEGYKLSDKVIFSSDISMENLIKIKIRDDNDLLIVLDGNNPPFKKNSFDCIIASEIIEHTLNPYDFLTELVRILKPGGKIVLTTPYKEKLRYSLCIHCNKKTPVNAHLHSFDEKNLNEIGMQSKLEVEAIYKFGNKVLNYLYFYHLLNFFPYKIWKIIDNIANFFIKKPVHILVVFRKRAD